MSRWKRLRLVLAFVLGLYLARMYVTMGWVKFDPEGFWTAAFDRWGYPAWFRVAIGAAEVGGGFALLIPWVASWGAALLGAVMFGAMFTRAGDGRWVDVAWNGLYTIGLLWIAWEWWAWRRPKLRAADQDG